MTDDLTMLPFRRALFTWAAAKLEQHCQHTGPFEVTKVYVQSVDGYSIENDYVEVCIVFRHDNCTLYVWDGHPTCTVAVWCLPDTTDTVTMLNELLALEA